jgi:regulator of sigma E protease
MLAILAPILVFGLVIFVHELGHFLAAKAVGVYAPRFSIGFGPSLWRKRWGETEYVLAALPLGGYVRMASRLDEDVAALEGGSESRTAKSEGDRDFDPNAMIPFGPRPIPAHRLFESKPLAARLLILIAGVTMNALLALVVAIGLTLHVGRTIVDTTVVGGVTPLPAAPELAQLQLGDTVRRVNGRDVKSWNDVLRTIAGSRDIVEIQTQRGQIRVPVGGKGRPSGEDIANAIDVYVPPVIDTIMKGDRADAAGFRRGDSVVAINTRPVRTWSDLVMLVSRAPEQALTVDVVRSGGPVALHVTPKSVQGPDPETGEVHAVGKIGAGPRSITRREPVSVGEAITTGARATWIMAGSIVDIVKRLIVGQLSVRQLSGPVGITRMSVEAARSGLESLFSLIALLSINVAVLNLLPIPILDGGQILINVLESAKGKPFSLRTREYILRFGLLAIALLFVVVMYNDTRSWLVKLAGWVARLFG